MAKEAAVVADVEVAQEGPEVYRVSEFRRACEAYITANKLDPLTFDRHKFQREQGLPNPTRLYEVQAMKAGSKVESAESRQFEAVDPSEAIAKYKDSFGGETAKELQKTTVRFEVRIIAE